MDDVFIAELPTPPGRGFWVFEEHDHKLIIKWCAQAPKQPPVLEIVRED